MPLIILTVIVQVAFIMHIVQHGKNRNWVWIVLMLPLAGALAYFIMEVLPDLRHNRKLQALVNPNKDFKQATRNFTLADTVENSRRLAEECVAKGMYAEARELYNKSLQGIYADDPDLLYALASTEFELADYFSVKDTLERLRLKNPDYRNSNAHLLYARALDKLQEFNAALHEYEALHGYFPGPEASYHYAKLLKSLGHNEQAQSIFREIITKADLQGKHYRNLHKDYLKMTSAELRS